MKERERCGQSRDGLVCDRWRDHDGDHRGYNEQIDEPMFWSTTCRARHSSGVRCELPEGHTVNHKGADAHAIYQWPEELQCRSKSVVDAGDSAGRSSGDARSVAREWLVRQIVKDGREPMLDEGDCRLCGHPAGEGHEPTDPCGIVANLLIDLEGPAGGARACNRETPRMAQSTGTFNDAPIPLPAAVIEAIRTWAADDRLWSTKETTEFNLCTFARLVLKAKSEVRELSI